MLRACAAGELIGDYYVSDDRSAVFLDIDIPENYRFNDVVEPLIHKYRAVLEYNWINICAYDHNDIPAVCVLSEDKLKNKQGSRMHTYRHICRKPVISETGDTIQ